LCLESFLLNFSEIISHSFKFNLGKKADQLNLHGQLKKTSVDLGDDRANDQVTLDSLEQVVNKKLIITNFGRDDIFNLGGQIYTQEDLVNVDFDVIKIVSKGGTILA